MPRVSGNSGTCKLTKSASATTSGSVLVEEIRSALPGHDVDVFDSRGWADSELIARCAGAEVLASTNRPISVSVIDALEGLRLIAIAFAGVDSVAAAAAERHGVTVTNARGYADTAVAELTVGLMISLARQIPAQNVAIRSGGTTSMGTQLRGKTIAVIGTGAIGTEVVRLCGAFGMTVIGFDEGSVEIPIGSITQILVMRPAPQLS